MYTQCPHCQTIFGVSEAHLSAAFGRVRCGHCHGQFNAKRHLLDEIPEQPEEESTAVTDPVVENDLATETPLELEPIDIDLTPVEEAHEEDITHIDLSEAADESGHEIIIELDEEKPAIQAPQMEDNSDVPPEVDQVELPVVEENASREELTAIFADLDQRLEKLSENTDEDVIKPHEEFELGDVDHSDFNDAFGDPENQTEDDIRASIETIFAAAEAELIKTETVDEVDEAPSEESQQEISLNEYLDGESNFDLNETALDDIEIEHLDFPDNAEDHETDPQNQPENEETVQEQAEAEADVTEAGTKSSTEEDSVESSPDFAQEEFPFALHATEEKEAKVKPGGLKVTILSIAFLLLCLVIAFQIALFRNVELADKLPILKPYLVSFCQYMPCQFSGKRDVNKIVITSRDVRTLPKANNVILINAIFVNRADFNQPYPDILITLSDLTATIVSQRRFTPTEYLNQQQGVFQLMKPGKPVHISLEVLNPGSDNLNFEFEFL